MDVNVGEVRLHVRDSGSGDPVVLLHGWPDSGDLWRDQIPALTAAGYRTVVPDLRGFGGSDKPIEIEAYSLSHIVSDIVGLLDALEIPRAHLVGHDWGAGFAWAVAMSAPQRVASLAALSVGHPTAFRRAGWAQLEKSWYMLLFQFPGIAERWISAENFMRLRGWSGHPDIDRVAEAMSVPGALTASLNVYRAAVHPRAFLQPEPQLPPVTCPVLGVWSSADRFLVEKQMTGSERFVTGPWRYERIDGVGHWLQREAPDRVNALLLDFLAAHKVSD